MLKIAMRDTTDSGPLDNVYWCNWQHIVFFYFRVQLIHPLPPTASLFGCKHSHPCPGPPLVWNMQQINQATGNVAGSRTRLYSITFGCLLSGQRGLVSESAVRVGNNLLWYTTGSCVLFMCPVTCVLSTLHLVNVMG